MLVSVIIPVYNDLHGLEKCLACLSVQTIPRADYEVLVVDNNSTVSVQSVLSVKFPEVRFILEAKSGPYAARNTGIRAALGNVLAFTDADCLPTAAWLEEGLRALEMHASTGFVGGNIYVSVDNIDNCYELYERLFAFNVRQYVLANYFAPTANLFTWKKIFDSCGLFSEQYMSSGDLEWGKRICAKGYLAGYAEHSLVVHPARNSLRALLSKNKRVVTENILVNKTTETILQLITRSWQNGLVIIAEIRNHYYLSVREKILLIFIEFVFMFQNIGIICGVL